jgi:hypothetical protein
MSWTNAWLLTTYVHLPSFNNAPLYWSWFCHFLQDIVPAPLARTISYSIEGPISALGYRSRTLAQLMSRYATLDPTLTSSASDKRKAPSLIASPAVKKKRTSKKSTYSGQNIFPCWTQCHLSFWPSLFFMIPDKNSKTIGHHRSCQCFTHW